MKAKLYILFNYFIAIGISYFCFTLLNNKINLLWATLISDLLCTLIIFMFSLIFNNSSCYDPYWSVIPPLIVLLWIINLSYWDLYSILILLTYLIWSIRLTYNWVTNWQGLTHEDWRYVNFRKRFKKGYWFTSFMGIHIFPTIVVFLGLLPIYFGLQYLKVQYYSLFICGILLSLLGVLISYIADINLTKHRNSINRKKSIMSGIWKYSRHPNYLGEITFWLGSFITGLSYSLENYFTVIGFIGMVLLFNLYSIPSMEKRLIQSKEDYSMVINKVPRLLPIKFRK
ncbi:MAG TPA: DUF1295 domain-containing protein [Haloplasmataceae bacterium]